MKVIYPGSFDPLTKGHMDIIKRLSSMFDEVIVAILNNENKSSLFTVDERKDIIKEEIRDEKLSNTYIYSFDGLLVKFAQDHDVKLIEFLQF